MRKRDAYYCRPIIHYATLYAIITSQWWVIADYVNSGNVELSYRPIYVISQLMDVIWMRAWYIGVLVVGHCCVNIQAIPLYLREVNYWGGAPDWGIGRSRLLTRPGVLVLEAIMIPHKYSYLPPVHWPIVPLHCPSSQWRCHLCLVV